MQRCAQLQGCAHVHARLSTLPRWRHLAALPQPRLLDKRGAHHLVAGVHKVSHIVPGTGLPCWVGAWDAIGAWGLCTQSQQGPSFSVKCSWVREEEQGSYGASKDWSYSLQLRTGGCTADRQGKRTVGCVACELARARAKGEMDVGGSVARGAPAGLSDIVPAEQQLPAF